MSQGTARFQGQENNSLIVPIKKWLLTPMAYNWFSDTVTVLSVTAASHYC